MAVDHQIVRSLALARLQDWPDRLTATIAGHQRQPFAWGSFDCATLWIEAVWATTGHDVAADLPRWFSRHSAMRSLARSGARSIEEFVAARFSPTPVAMARRGDLVCVATDDPLMGPAVVVGAEAVSRNEASWVVMPRTLAVRAYRIGD